MAADLMGNFIKQINKSVAPKSRIQWLKDRLEARWRDWEGLAVPTFPRPVPPTQGKKMPDDIKRVYNFPQGMEDGIRGELEQFTYEHLPPHLATVSEKFYHLAYELAELSPHHKQTENFLHYLLLAKDAAVRAAVVRHKQAELEKQSIKQAQEEIYNKPR